ncbi:MAG: hypothetical protein EOP88_15350 [Verrucomicrobiaceae bacterium]|nr:MAG: hypothetical protein EOP88_15350 [Verrucomicrobiaceae bacterium]
MLAVRPSNLKWTTGPRQGEPVEMDPACARVLKRLRKPDKCPPGWPDDWKADGPPQVRRMSTIHRLSSEVMGASICVKIINSPSRRGVDSKRLYAALRHYHDRSDRESGFTVPRPYGCLPKHGAIVMEWVEGRTFNDLLKQDQFNTRKRHENIRKVAGWLHWFHSQSDVECERLSAASQLDAIVEVFQESEGLDEAAMAGDPALLRHMSLAARHAGVLDGVEVETAILHGDFKPTNLLFSPNGDVVGIDFSGVRRGPVTQDICRFLIDLDFYRNLVRRSYALSPGSRSNDFKVFLSAYGGKAGAVPRPAFLYLYFLAVLSALVHQRRKFTPGASLWVRLTVFRSIARQLSGRIAPETRGSAAESGALSWFRNPRISAVRMSGAQIPVDWCIILWDSDLVWSLLSF